MWGGRVRTLFSLLWWPLLLTTLAEKDSYLPLSPSRRQCSHFFLVLPHLSHPSIALLASSYGTMPLIASGNLEEAAPQFFFTSISVSPFETCWLTLFWRPFCFQTTLAQKWAPGSMFMFILHFRGWMLTLLESFLTVLNSSSGINQPGFLTNCCKWVYSSLEMLGFKAILLVFLLWWGQGWVTSHHKGCIVMKSKAVLQVLSSMHWGNRGQGESEWLGAQVADYATLRRLHLGGLLLEQFWTLPAIYKVSFNILLGCVCVCVHVW